MLEDAGIGDGPEGCHVVDEAVTGLDEDDVGRIVEAARERRACIAAADDDDAFHAQISIAEPGTAP